MAEKHPLKAGLDRMAAGKGDKPRPFDKEKFEAGWERIFGKKEPEIKGRKGKNARPTQKHVDKKREAKKDNYGE